MNILNVLYNMKFYYKISNSIDINEIGNYPQTDLKQGYNPNLTNSIWNIKYNEIPNFILNYELELNKKAIPTNCIQGIDTSGLIVDYKLKKILEKFNLPEKKFFPIKVYQKGNLLEYYYFHFVFDLKDYIIKNLSTLKVISNNGSSIILPYLENENSIDELIKYYLMNINFSLKPNKLFINNEFLNYDLFSNNPFNVDIIISKKLRKELIKNNITGLKYDIVRYLF